MTEKNVKENKASTPSETRKPTKEELQQFVLRLVQDAGKAPMPALRHAENEQMANVLYRYLEKQKPKKED